MSLVLFLAALALCAARLAVLAGIFTRKLPRQTVNARSQVILTVDLYAAYTIGSELAHFTHSAWVTVFTWIFCMAYLFTIAVRFPMAYGQEYKPKVQELVLYALAQAVLVLAYFIAL